MLLWTLLGLLLALGAALLLYFQFAPRIGSDPSGERLARIQASPNYRDGKFQNRIETNMDMPVGTLLGVMWEFIKGSEGREPKDTIPVV